MPTPDEDAMVKRVAKAIIAVADTGDDYDNNKPFWDAHARAAIAAMREPTKEALISSAALAPEQDK